MIILPRELYQYDFFFWQTGGPCALRHSQRPIADLVIRLAGRSIKDFPSLVPESLSVQTLKILPALDELGLTFRRSASTRSLTGSEKSSRDAAPSHQLTLSKACNSNSYGAARPKKWEKSSKAFILTLAPER